MVAKRLGIIAVMVRGDRGKVLSVVRYPQQQPVEFVVRAGQIGSGYESTLDVSLGFAHFKYRYWRESQPELTNRVGHVPVVQQASDHQPILEQRHRWTVYKQNSNIDKGLEDVIRL